MAFHDFQKLAQSVVLQRCAIVIGAGVSSPLMPLASELALEMEAGLPPDHPARSDGLASVAQALSTINQPQFVKAQLQRRLRQALLQSDRFPEVSHTYDLIASLPVNVFITTNYDDLLLRALKRHPKDPHLMVAPWMDFGDDKRAPIKPPNLPTVAAPLVLHLHGHIDYSDTMVLTEDDYIQFLFAIAQDIDKSPRLRGPASLLPMAARRFLSSQNLLMLGYRAADINFRLLVKSAEALLTSPRTIGPTGRVRVSVQLRPEKQNNECGVMEYVERMYEHSLSFQLFWGSARQFLELLQPSIRIAQESLGMPQAVERLGPNDQE
jgi:SIR2-like domain